MENIQDIINQIVPRRTLQEHHFRKYETQIASACFGSMTITPKIKASSFVLNIKEAMLGYRTYHYSSTLIPSGYDVRNIKASVLANGDVFLHNKTEDARVDPHQYKSRIFLASDRSTTEKLINDLALNNIKGPVHFRIDTQADEDFIRLTFGEDPRISIGETVDGGILKVF